MEALLVSAGAVAVAEIGDKTQLLAILLAARFRAPLAIVLGIFVATAVNHGLAALLGDAVSAWVTPDMLRLILALSFAAMAVWMLLPDKLDDGPKMIDRLGAFGATAISFFLIEMGDKTQLATIALAAHYHTVFMVAVGTTLGMMIADVPAVYLGELATRKIPLKLMRGIAAIVFLLLALLALMDYFRRFLYA
jgi:putative Ca2+/H+ antiporter (TMEM165/GDT1 family)